MKTLDEALSIAAPLTGELGGGVVLSLPGQRTHEKLIPLVERYSPTAQECIANRKVQRICMALWESVGNGHISAADALTTAFITGLIVGIEMEKAE